MAAVGDGGARSWPDRHPDFERGNSAAVTHGATSPPRLLPLAEAFAAALLADDATPGYLKDPLYARAVMGWARAEAVVDLLSDWLSGQDLEAGLTEVTRSAETEDREGGRDEGGRVTRKSVSRRTAGVLEQLRKHEVLAMNLRAQLGLSPLARARLGKDVASQKADLARLWAEQDRAEAAAGGAGGAEVCGTESRS